MNRDYYKAAVLFEQNKPLELVELIHSEPSDGNVKVKMISAGLCGAQVNEISGKKGEDKFLPHLMGHEGFGVVQAVGKGVQNIKPGDCVVLHWRPGVGLNGSNKTFTSVDGKRIGAGPVTTFSEYTVVSENRCTVVPAIEGLELVMPLLGCALSTAYGAVKYEAQLRKHDRVLIVGAGGLGMAIMFWCKVFGVNHVDVVDLQEKKSIQVREFSGNFYNSMVDCEKATYDAIFETTGSVSNVEYTLDLVAKSGSIILIGQVSHSEKVTFKNFLHFYDEVKMIASRGGNFQPENDMQAILQHVIDNKDMSLRLISETVSLENVNKGFDLMKTQNSRRVIIDFSL